jgi:hypothetical protein
MFQNIELFITYTMRTSNPTVFNSLLIFAQVGSEANYGELPLPLEKAKQRTAVSMDTGEKTI